MFNRKDLRFVSYSMVVMFMFLCLAAVMACQGCAITKTVDWRKLDSPTKRYHYAQLTFESLQEDYISMFPSQTEETKEYLRKNVAPIMHDAKLALGAWGEVITKGELNTGQESNFSELLQDLTLLLTPYLSKEKK